MGRNKKTGLDYFPFDVDFFSDLKIRKLIKYQGGKAVAVYALLLCNIYKNGYYTRWDNELPFVISEQTGFDEVYIQEVIKSCMVVGLLSKKLFESDKIITSKGIQERYKNICSLTKRVCKISNYGIISSEEMRINSEEMRINSEEMRINSEEMRINSEESTQRKENKIKKEKIKRKSTDDLKSEFEVFRKAYPGTKKGLNMEFDNFVKKTQDHEQAITKLLPALNDLLEWRGRKRASGSFVPEFAHLSTWINQRRWETEFEKIENEEDETNESKPKTIVWD